MSARDRTRLHALDGAVLLFQPSTGASIRIETQATAAVRRRAPRVVLFSLSHACNLACAFCCRDADQHARWSEDDAVRTLTALWRAGTLEVSFGGGEPLVHAWFPSLLERLHRETTLALHLTTNGTRVTPGLAQRLAALTGEIRLSVYADVDWVSALRMLAEAGCRVGANVVVTPASLGELPAILRRAATAGACDVAVLRYVGDDPALAAAPVDLSMLEQAILGSPLPVRVSNCLLDAMPNVPRLFPGITVAGPSGLCQDCGAGRDFVVVDPDASVRSCSFHDDRVPMVDVRAWLERYRTVADRAPAPRGGCARPVGLARPSARGAFVYRAFASNNSGDTLLVARFEEVGAAEGFVAGLPEVPDDAAWDAFFREQGVLAEGWRGESPSGVLRLGRTLLASGYDADDALIELRALLWRARATTIYSAVHVHGSPTVVAAIRDPQRQLDTELSGYGLEPIRRGPLLLAHGVTSDWVELLTTLQAELADRRWTAELVDDDETPWTEVTKHLDDERWSPEGYLYVRCGSPERAARLASTLDGAVSFAGDTVLCSVRRFRPRLGTHLSSDGGSAWWIPQMPVRLRAWTYRTRRHGELAPEPLLDAAGPTIAVTVGPRGRVGAVTETDDPHAAMAHLQRLFVAIRAQASDAVCGVWVAPLQPLLATTRRVQHELRLLR